MKITYELFATIDPMQMRNYLYTHGFIIIQQFFSKNEIERFNKIWDENFLELTKNNKSNTETYRTVDEFIEIGGFGWYSGNLGNKFLKIVDDLVGRNACYVGSSANEIRVPTPWHRDVFIQTPMFKFACYINNGDDADEGGQLCVVPGSQHAGDCYSDSMGAAVNWPEGGGIYKSPAFFPMLKASDKSDTVNNYPTRGGVLQSLPNVIVDVKSEDLLIFDPRLIHGSTPYYSGRARRMLLSMFTVNPNDVADNSRMVFRGYKKYDALLELEKYAQLRLNSSEMNYMYQAVHDAGLTDVLKNKLDIHKNLISQRVHSTTVRDGLDKYESFFKKNMSNRGAPVCF